MSERENARAQREARESAVSRVTSHPAETLAERAIRRYVLAGEVSRKSRKAGRTERGEKHEKRGEGAR